MMTTALVCAIILLVFVAATQRFMLAHANEYVTSTEDFILYLDDGTPAYVMPAELRADLAAEADDIREMRKEAVDE